MSMTMYQVHMIHKQVLGHFGFALVFTVLSLNLLRFGSQTQVGLAFLGVALGLGLGHAD